MNVSFSDDTICLLENWVLSSSYYAALENSAPPQSHADFLTRLTRDDLQFSTWLSRQVQSDASDCTQPSSSIPTLCTGTTVPDPEWEADTRKQSGPLGAQSEHVDRLWLIERLIKDASWSVHVQSSEFQLGQLERGHGDHRMQIEWRLWQLLQLVWRLHVLQANFDQTLAQAKQRFLYDMAYGLSHEINNPLANIASRANILATSESAIHRRQMLASIVDQAMRGSEMIADLMLVARPPRLVFDNLQFVELWHEIVRKASPWARSMRVSLVQDAMEVPEGATVCADRVALQEAIWCIIRNAIEAASQAVCTGSSSQDVAKDSGWVGLELRIAAVGDRKYIIVHVKDNGAGLSEEALQNCLNPYYSGREAGRGLGLGLAKVDRIVSLHKGTIRIANAPSGGCIATLHLPLFD